MHAHDRAHQNPQFAWAIGDLNDMMALGTAAAYCDIVVAEKKWGDVLQRNRKYLRATVITDVAGFRRHWRRPRLTDRPKRRHD